MRRKRVEFEDRSAADPALNDDGAGMGPEDLALAFVPHATSKLTTAADLAEIRSFGFRGKRWLRSPTRRRARIVSRPRGVDATRS